MQRLVHKRNGDAAHEFVLEAEPPRLASIPLEAVSALCALSALAVFWSQASLLSAPLAALCAAALASGAAWLAAVQYESVRVLRGVGVVLETRRRSGLLRRTFIDAERIRSVVINEGVTTTDIRHYLAFVPQNAGAMAVAFPNLLPRLDVLRPVYREVHALLGPADGGGAEPASSSGGPRRT